MYLDLRALELFCADLGVAAGLTLGGLVAGLLLGTLLFLWVMTERIVLRMRRLNSLDPLTGAFIRTAFVRRFEREITRARRRADARFGVLLIDVDRFRQVNDTCGSAAADRLLAGIAEIARRVIGRNDLIGRLEGDVFMILMPGTVGEAAMEMAGRVRRKIKRRAAMRTSLGNRVTVSVGVAVFGEHGESWDEVLRAADAAAKSAKAYGRDRVEFAMRPDGSAPATMGRSIIGNPVSQTVGKGVQTLVRHAI